MPADSPQLIPDAAAAALADVSRAHYPSAVNRNLRTRLVSNFSCLTKGYRLMDIEDRDITTIQLYGNNPRKNDHAIDAVAASIREFGFRQPIVVDEAGVIVVGSTRYKAAQKLGLRAVPVHVARGLTAAQLKAYRIADNKTAELADWDQELLIQELTDLEKLDFNLDALGFSADELQELFHTEIEPGLTDPDAVPEPPDQAVTQNGDLWVMGEHRLLCGDAGNKGDIDQLLAGAGIHLIHTDPPYNVCLEPRSNNAIAAGLSSFPQAAAQRVRREGGKKIGRGGPMQRDRTHHQKFDLARHPEKSQPTSRKLRPKDRPLANDYVSDEAFDKLLRAWFGNMAQVLLPGHSFYLWGGYANCGNYPPALKAKGLYFSQALIWDKQHPVLTRKDFMGAHEWCFYGWREGKAHRFFGPKNISDLWSIKKINPQSMIHLTEKPVELARRAMQFSSRPNEIVLDLFAGSGSTLIAAEQTGRRAMLMEIDALYCDVIVRRWEAFTGQQASRQEPVPSTRRAPCQRDSNTVN